MLLARQIFGDDCTRSIWRHRTKERPIKSTSTTDTHPRRRRRKKNVKTILLAWRVPALPLYFFTAAQRSVLTLQLGAEFSLSRVFQVGRVTERATHTRKNRSSQRRGAKIFNLFLSKRDSALCVLCVAGVACYRSSAVASLRLRRICTKRTTGFTVRGRGVGGK